MRRRPSLPRLAFPTQFAIVVILLGVAVAAAVLYIPLTQSGAQARQTALDRVSEQSALILSVLNAEESSLSAFAVESAQLGATSPDSATLVSRLSAAAGAQDIVGVGTPTSASVAMNGQPLADSVARPLLAAAASNTRVVADDRGHPWLVGAAVVPGTAGIYAFVARDIAHSQVSALLTTTTTYGNGGFAVVRDGKFALPGRVDGSIADASAPVDPNLVGPSSSDGPSTIVETSNGEIAGASTSIGGGFRILVTAGVANTRTLADDVPVVVVTVALTLLALVFIYGLVRRQLERPLERLDTALSALAREEFDVPVRVTGEDVLGSVTDSFVTMRTELRSLLRAKEARAEIATDLSSPATLDSALRAVCERLRAATDAQLALVVIAGGDGRPPALQAAGLPQPRDAQSLLTGDGVVATAAREPDAGAVLACPIAGPEADLGLDEVCAAALHIGTTALGAMAVAGSRHGAGFGRHARELVEAAAEQVALAVERERVLVMARLQASTDSLTGLYNRRFLTDFLEQQLAIADRVSSTFSVVMIDIDHFKAVNDEFGHEIGDEALRQVAGTLSGTLRRSDLAARLGGDEFLVVMSETALEAAGGVAEKLRRAIAAVRVASPTTRRRARITVSVGVASRAPGGPGVDRLLTLVDDALYEAKRAGRDRVVLAPSSDGQSPPADGGAAQPIDISRGRRARQNRRS